MDHRPASRVIGWVRAKDPGLLAVKRSVRAAVVMPLVFGLTHLLFSDPQTSLFGAFGSFALLLLVDFPGRPRTRLGLLRRSLPRRRWLHRPGHGGLDREGGRGGGHGRGRVRRAVRRDHLAARQRPQPRLRSWSSSCRWPWPSPSAPSVPRLVGWDRRRRHLHSGLHADLAHPLARQPPSAPVGHGGGGRTPGPRPGRGQAAIRKPTPPSGRSCPCCGTSSPGPPTPRPAPPPARWPWPSWSAGWSGWPTMRP